MILFDWGGRSGKGRNELYFLMNLVISLGAVEASAKEVNLSTPIVVQGVLLIDLIYAELHSPSVNYLRPCFGWFKRLIANDRYGKKEDTAHPSPRRLPDIPKSKPQSHVVPYTAGLLR